MENVILKRFKESAEVKTRFLKENLPKLLEAIKLISHAFEAGNIPNPMTDLRYYNVKMMQAIKMTW